MATVTLRSDRFPVGATVGIYPAGSFNPSSGLPSVAAIASAAVDAAGLLTVTNAGIVDGVPYAAHAVVSSEPRTVRVSSATTVMDRGTATRTVTTTSGSKNITTVLSTGVLAIGQRFVSANTPGARLASGSATSWVLSTPATATGAGVAFAADGARAPVVVLGTSPVPQVQSTWQAQLAQRRAAMGTS
jgi:hypothetical protein